MAYKQKINPRTGKFDMVSPDGGGVDIPLATENNDGKESSTSKLLRDHSFINLISLDSKQAFATPEAANNYLMTKDSEYYPVSGQTIRFLGADGRMHDFRYNGNYLIDRNGTKSWWCGATYDIPNGGWIVSDTNGSAKLRTANSRAGVFWGITSFPDTSTERWSMMASCSFGSVVMSGNGSKEYVLSTDCGDTWESRILSYEGLYRSVKRAFILIDNKPTETLLFIEDGCIYYLPSSLNDQLLVKQNEILFSLGYGSSKYDIETKDAEYFLDETGKENLFIIFTCNSVRYLSWIRKNNESWTEVAAYTFATNTAVNNVSLKDGILYCSVGDLGGTTSKDSCTLSMYDNTISLIETYTDTSKLIPTEYGLVRIVEHKQIYVEDTLVELPTTLSSSEYLSTFAFDGDKQVMCITGGMQYSQNNGNYAFRLDVQKKQITNDAEWEELPIITEEDHGVVTVEDAKVRPAVFDEYINYSKSNRKISANASDRNLPYANYLLKGSDHEDVFCKVTISEIVDNTTKVYSDETCTVEVGTISAHRYNLSNPDEVSVLIGTNTHVFKFVEDKIPASLATTKAVILDRPATETRMGYKVLNPALSFASQVTEANTIYEIRDGFDLGGATVTIPENCVLKFEGGKVSGGTLTGNKTMIEYNSVCFGNDIQFSGDWNVKIIYSNIIENPDQNNALCKLITLCNSASYNKIIIEEGTYILTLTEVNQILLNLPSNTDFENSGTIKIAPNGYKGYSIIGATERSNVRIKGGSYIGDVDEHDYSSGGTHEWGYCIRLNGCNTSSITNVECKNATGDGLNLRGSDIFVSGAIISHCGRQGITIYDCDRIKILNFKITDIFRVSPRAGIDIEPNTGIANKVIIENGYLEAGIHMTKASNISISNIEAYNVTNIVLAGGTVNSLSISGIKCSQSVKQSYTGLFNIKSGVKSCIISNLQIETDLTTATNQFVFYIEGNADNEEILVKNSHISARELGVIKRIKFINCILNPGNGYALPNNSSSGNQKLSYLNCTLNGKLVITGYNVRLTNCILNWQLSSSTNYLIFSSTADVDNVVLEGCTFNNTGGKLTSFIQLRGHYTVRDCTFNTSPIKSIFGRVEGNDLVELYLSNLRYNIGDYTDHFFVLLNDYFKLYYNGFDASNVAIIDGGTINSSLSSNLFVNSNKFILAGNLDLVGNSITLPNGCTLDTNGCTITNGTLTLNGANILPFYNAVSNVAIGSPGRGCKKVESNGRVLTWNGVSWLDSTTSDNGIERPSSPNVGQIFFDTSLNKPIFYTGSKWIDATGAEI